MDTNNDTQSPQWYAEDISQQEKRLLPLHAQPSTRELSSSAWSQVHEHSEDSIKHLEAHKATASPIESVKSDHYSLQSPLELSSQEGEGHGSMAERNDQEIRQQQTHVSEGTTSTSSRTSSLLHAKVTKKPAGTRLFQGFSEIGSVSSYQTAADPPINPVVKTLWHRGATKKSQRSTVSKQSSFQKHRKEKRPRSPASQRKSLLLSTLSSAHEKSFEKLRAQNRQLNKPLPDLPLQMAVEEMSSVEHMDGVVDNFHGKLFKVAFHHSPQLYDELTLVPGQFVRVYQLFDDGWYMAKSISAVVNQPAQEMCLRPCLVTLS